MNNRVGYPVAGGEVAISSHRQLQNHGEKKVVPVCFGLSLAYYNSAKQQLALVSLPAVQPEPFCL